MNPQEMEIIKIIAAVTKLIVMEAHTVKGKILCNAKIWQNTIKNKKANCHYT